LTVLSGFFSGFHVSSNDFWTLLYYGRHMTWEYKESLYNGFYPFGYAFLVGQLPYTYAIQLSYLLNALLSGLFAASVSALVSQRRFLPATLLACVLSLTQPLVHQYSNTPGPDIGTAAFPAFAIYLLWKDALADQESSLSNFSAVLVGAFLGLGFLWRTHVLVIAVIVLALAILFRRVRSGYSITLMAGTFLALVSLQAAVDLLSGHRAFETAQLFNIYKLLYGLDWVQPPTPDQISKLSIVEIFWSDPRFVINSAYPYFRHLVSFAWPSVVCLFLSPKGALRRFAFFSMLSIVLYSLPLSLSDSPRAPLPVLSLTLSTAALIFAALMERLRSFLSTSKSSLIWGTVLVLVFSASPVYRWGVHDWTFLKDIRAAHRVFKGIEQVLLSNGMKSPDEVFSNKYQFYVPSRPPFTPRQFSDWYNDWVWGYSEEYPPLANDSWDAFRQSCLEQGIKFIVLSPLASEQAEFFAVIYEDKFDDDVVGLEFITARANMRIYRFK
jgi:hypothetical protein